MITLDELCSVLDGLGIPWANEGYIDEKTTLPYISLEAGFSDGLYADNISWIEFMSYEIILYTKARDYPLEATIAHALDANGCPFEKSVQQVESEHLVEVSFSVNLIEESGE